MDVTFSRWGRERRTRFHATHPPYQLDIALATSDVNALVQATPEVDAEWVDADTARERALADHAPVWLQLQSGSR